VSVLVAYATRYGSTRQIAERVAGEVSGATAFDIGSSSSVDPRKYDIVVIGGPVYAGKILPAVPKFCEAHRDALSQVPVALFVSCLYTGEQAAQQLESAFPPWLLSRAFGKYTVGGEVHMEELSFFHKLIMKGVMKTSTDISAVDESGVRKLISEIQARVTG
jgi:menaquinone-dependent protoporphyrinogen oxidase